MKTFRMLALLALSTTFAVFAHATVLFSNGSTTLDSGFCSSCTTDDWRVFDSFSLSQDSIISSIDFLLGVYPATTTITVSIWNDVNTGLLYSQDFTLSELGGTNPGGGNWIKEGLTATGLSWSLDAGTYWISFFGPYVVVPAVDGLDGSISQVNLSDSSINARPYDASFTINGTVVASNIPEPASLALMGLGLAGMVFSRRKAEKR